MKQYVILISGKQGSGKTTLADSLCSHLHLDSYFGLKRTRFAKVLYKMHDAVREIGREYGIPFPDKIGPLLQYMGTELVRNTYGENAWVDCVKKELSDLDCTNFIIIDDCRFPNEVKAFDNNPLYKVIKVRLEASREARKGRADGWRDNDTHASETGLDDYSEWDVIVNTAHYSAKEVLGIVISAINEWAPGHNVLKHT